MYLIVIFIINVIYQRGLTPELVRKLKNVNHYHLVKLHIYYTSYNPWHHNLIPPKYIISARPTNFGKQYVVPGILSFNKSFNAKVQ